MIRINLDNTFEPILANDNFTEYTFESVLFDSSSIKLKIKITNLNDPLLPNICNLAFGPVDLDNQIDDFIKLKHANTNRVFSTILLCAITFLQKYPDKMIGIDGSNDIRAYLYHRMFRFNYEYLDEYIISIGVDWYVRLLRNGNIEIDDTGLPYFKPKLEPFDLKRNPTDLYLYYVFYLKI